MLAQPQRLSAFGAGWNTIAPVPFRYVGAKNPPEKSRQRPAAHRLTAIAERKDSGNCTWCQDQQHRGSRDCDPGYHKADQCQHDRYLHE
jgi:hypothetical protein